MTFTTSTTQVTANDVVGTFLKSALTPLQNFVLKQHTFMAYHKTHQPPPKEDEILKEQAKILDQLVSVSTQIANATVGLTCLEIYKALDISNTDFSCNPTVNLDAGSFAEAKSRAVAYLVAGAEAVLPLAESQNLDQQLKTKLAAAEKDKKSLITLNEYLSNQALIK